MLVAETKVRIGTLFLFSPSIRPKQAQTRARSDVEGKDGLPHSALPKVFDSPVTIPGVFCARHSDDYTVSSTREGGEFEKGFCYYNKGEVFYPFPNSSTSRDAETKSMNSVEHQKGGQPPLMRASLVRFPNEQEMNEKKYQ